MKNKETHYLGQFPYNNENQGDHDIILMKIKVTLTKKIVCLNITENHF
jgi:hypothetical protein